MATFSEIYFNGSEYTQMWFNGSKIWEKNNGGFPYSVDSVITYKYSNAMATPITITFDIIDDTLPYYLNGMAINTKTYMGMFSGESTVKLVNLSPSNTSSHHMKDIAQLRIPKVTDLSNLFSYFCYDSDSTYTWSPQYFEFNENPTNMNFMFYYCNYLTDELMNQFIPYFPNTSSVTNMGYMFGNCSSLTSLDLSHFNTSKVTNMGDMFTGCRALTSLDLSNFDTSSVTDMSYMFYDCSKLTSLDLSSFDTSKVTSMRYMFYSCSKLTSLDLSSWDTSKVTSTTSMFNGVKNCTVYISDKWTLGTSSTFANGSGLKFVRINPITSITLESTLTDTTITKGTQFTITPTVIPSNHTDELVITYDTNALFMTDNVFTVLDGANIGALDITYSSKLNPSISATYTITIRDFIDIASITLEHTLDSLIIEPNTTFTITPITTPTPHDDELLVEFDDTYITHNDGVFTITNAPFNESMSITYYSKANPSVNATLNLVVRDFIPITSITLEHTLDSLVIEPNTMFTVTPVIVPTVNDDEVMIEFDDTYMAYNDGVFTVTNAPFNEPLSIKYSSKFDSTVNATLDLAVRGFIPITSITLEHTLETLVDVMVGTTFTVTPIIMPTIYDGLLVDYDTNYLSKDDNTFTVLSGASGQTVQIIYYSEYDNSVNAILEFNVESVTVYPYDDADSVITYRNTSSSSTNKTFTVIDGSLPYSINGTSTTSFSFPNGETQVKLVNLKPTTSYNLSSTFFPTKFEQLRIPNLDDLSELFNYFCYDSNYEYSWSPQYFEFSENITDISDMFYNCRYLTDEMMNQFMPYFPPSASTLNATSITFMFNGCESLTQLDLSNALGYMDDLVRTARVFLNSSKLEKVVLSNFNAPKATNVIGFFEGCTSLKEIDLMNLDTSNITTTDNMFGSVKNATIYIGDKWTLGTTATFGGGTNNTFVKKIVPIESINSLTCDVDVNNVTNPLFTIKPTIYPIPYSYSDLEVIYDSTYLSTSDNTTFILKDGSQGKTLDITYRSKTDNSISRTISVTVSEDAVLVELFIDFTQSTAPTLPDYLTIDYNGSYKFSHGTYTTGVYGLIPNNRGKKSTTAYTRYKYVAPKSGDLTFTYRCNAETNYDYLTVHVNTSTNQPSTTSATNQVFTTKGVSTYQNTDGTASVSVVGGTTYYIHIQYTKDSSGDSGYDRGCIRKIELI